MLEQPLFNLHVEMPPNPNRHHAFSVSKSRMAINDKMVVALNSVSLSLHADSSTQTLILPSSKFNKFVKLIQLHPKEEKSSKQHPSPFYFNQQWKHKDKAKLGVIESRRKRDRMKEDPREQEQKWVIMRKKVQAGQLNTKFPQLNLFKNSLKIALPSTSQQKTKGHFKSKSSILKSSENNLVIKKRVESKLLTEPMNSDCEISGWTMNGF